MKIAIAGAGLTGAYVYRLLVERGFKADVYDLAPSTRCGINPCAWGTSRGFVQGVEFSGLDPERYILQRPDTLLMNDVSLNARLMTFRKPEFVSDLLKGGEIRLSPLDIRAYDRVIDATGVSRAYLPPLNNDIVLPCVQFRLRTGVPLENRVKLGGIGYAWCFPLAPHEYHVGCGSLLQDPQNVLEGLGWIDKVNVSADVLCRCKGRVRLTGPHGSRPFVAEHEGREIWGVGEAIGCVAPLAGDGIISGMKSAEILMKHWDDRAAYSKAILKEFGWMKGEREVLDCLRTNRPPGLKEAWVLKRNSRRMGMEIMIGQAARLLKSLR